MILNTSITQFHYKKLYNSGQSEKQYPNGVREIRFPDKTIKTIYNDGSERSVFADGWCYYNLGHLFGWSYMIYMLLIEWIL